MPSIVLAVAFPDVGAMPFAATDFVRLAAVLPLPILLVPRRERGLRLGAALYLAAIVTCFVVGSPVGANITRLGECVAAPLTVCALWGHRHRLLAADAFVPLFVMQWSPAFANITRTPDLSGDSAYYAGLLAFLRTHAEPAGRVEVVPTAHHWEAAMVAPSVPLARGWERQLDTARNPIFYERDALTSASCVRWLVDSGVRYVALPDAPLDYAGVAEGRLVAHRVPGLTRVWSDTHWHVFEVEGSSGIVAEAARLVRAAGSEVVLAARAPGVVVVRVRFTTNWQLTEGAGCVEPTSDGWTQIEVARAGRLRLQLELRGDPDNTCA